MRGFLAILAAALTLASGTATAAEPGTAARKAGQAPRKFVTPEKQAGTRPAAIRASASRPPRAGKDAVGKPVAAAGRRSANGREKVARVTPMRRDGRSGPRTVRRDRGAEAALLAAAAPARVSLGDAIGLHRQPDPLALRSSVALVVDPRTSDVLYAKNPHYVLPIASLTKLMTAMVVLDAGQPMDDLLEVSEDDRDRERASRSNLPIGSRLSRRELLQLALMASENRAASAVARHYPGGLSAFVAAANRKAASLGMIDTTFADGTGLSARNASTAIDLARMVTASSQYAEIRQMSTAAGLTVRLARGERHFHTTNRLVGSPTWQLDLQKTGYISEAGNCMVMQARVDGAPLVVVLLDSYGRFSRLGDAERIRRWITEEGRGARAAPLQTAATADGSFRLVAQR